VISHPAEWTGTISVSAESELRVRQRNARSSGLISRIDVSALAAVMFVLVFAFMFLIESPHDGVSADLPRVWHSIPMRGANREDALMVSILRDGTVYFGTDKSWPGDLPAQIRAAVGRGGEKKIYIRADARVRYRTVRDVLDAVRSSGLEKVAFLVYQRHAVSSSL
jgi:biopolymer transport protein TolR